MTAAAHGGRDVPQARAGALQLAFPSVKLDTPTCIALDLLATVLGGGESSISCEEIRDKQQLVSAIAVGDDTPSYVDGTFTVDMELDPAKIARRQRPCWRAREAQDRADRPRPDRPGQGADEGAR